jgi:hypothetical protein
MAGNDTALIKPWGSGLASPSGNILFFDEERITIIVVPKAACTSLKQTLALSYNTKSHREMTAEMKDSLPSGLSDWKYSLRALRLAAPERTGEGWLKIAVVRNPWERARSMYTDKCRKRRQPNRRLRDLGFYKDMPFRRFCRLVHSIPDEHAEKHFRSQYLTTHLLGPPDMILTVEWLDNSWRIIQKLFAERGEQRLPDLPRYNDTDSVRRPKWDSETVGLLAERYATDIELLKYEKGRPRCR